MYIPIPTKFPIIPSVYSFILSAGIYSAYSSPKEFIYPSIAPSIALVSSISDSFKYLLFTIVSIPFNDFVKLLSLVKTFNIELTPELLVVWVFPSNFTIYIAVNILVTNAVNIINMIIL